MPACSYEGSGRIGDKKNAGVEAAYVLENEGDTGKEAGQVEEHPDQQYEGQGTEEKEVCRR